MKSVRVKPRTTGNTQEGPSGSGDAGDNWAWMPESFCGLERCFDLRSVSNHQTQVIDAANALVPLNRHLWNGNVLASHH